jgi:hypothetical protein
MLSSVSKFPAFERGLYVLISIAFGIKDWKVASVHLEKLRKLQIESRTLSPLLYQFYFFFHVLQVSFFLNSTCNNH